VFLELSAELKEITNSYVLIATLIKRLITTMIVLISLIV